MKPIALVSYVRAAACPASPMYNIAGSTSVIEFKTDVLGNLSITETDPTPANTAYGLLADFVNAVR